MILSLTGLKLHVALSKRDHSRVCKFERVFWVQTGEDLTILSGFQFNGEGVIACVLTWRTLLSDLFQQITGNDWRDTCLNHNVSNSQGKRIQYIYLELI